MSAQFATTQWSQVLAARDGVGTASQQALAELCEAYWSPLYVFVRCQGHDPEEARDLTQGYFAYLLEKDILQDVEPQAGRFRSFLLASLKHFVANEWRRQRTLKRGGGTTTISLDAGAAEKSLRLEPMDQFTPEQAYERRWALTVLERAMNGVEADWVEAGRGRRFRLLKAHLVGQEPRPPLRELAQELAMTEVAVRGALHRLRRDYGQRIRDEIVETVVGPGEVDDEIRHLLSVVGPWESRQG